MTRLPKILSNSPQGEDLYKSKSHEQVAKAIFKIITNGNSNYDKKIIGLNGNWGSGKSNVIKILEKENELKNDLFFLFDAWTHQEDLTKKNILDNLLNFLDEKEIINIKSDWKDRYDKLFEKKITKKTSKTPQIKFYWIFAILSILIIQFGNILRKDFFSETLIYLIENFYIDFKSSIDWIYILRAIIIIVPIIFIALTILSFLYSLVCRIFFIDKEEKLNNIGVAEILKELKLHFYWASGEKTEEGFEEVIHNSEPTNYEFRSFLKDIDNQLLNLSKKLIFTIDNSDRVTNEKLNVVWSIINTFFVDDKEQKLNNIWLVIPYDKNKLASCFNNTDDKDFGVGMIDKTFSFNVTIPPPLLSNWEDLFDNKFNEAFENINIDNKSEELYLIKRIFEVDNKTIKPRDIVNFINQLSIGYIKNPSILLRYYSFFTKCQDKILSGDINEIIINLDFDETYLGLFLGDDKLQLNLSKIIYGLTNDSEAEEVLYEDVISKILHKEKNISLFSKLLEFESFETIFIKNFEKFLQVSEELKLQEFILFNQIFDLIKGKTSFIKKTYWNLINKKLQLQESQFLIGAFKKDEGLIDNYLKYSIPSEKNIIIMKTLTQYLSFFEHFANSDYFDFCLKIHTSVSITYPRTVVKEAIILLNLVSKGPEFIEKFNIDKSKIDFTEFIEKQDQTQSAIKTSTLLNYIEEVVELNNFGVEILPLKEPTLNSLKLCKTNNIKEFNALFRLATLFFTPKEISINQREYLKILPQFIKENEKQNFFSLLIDEFILKKNYASVPLLLDLKQIDEKFLKEILNKVNAKEFIHHPIDVNFSNQPFWLMLLKAALKDKNQEEKFMELLVKKFDIYNKNTFNDSQLLDIINRKEYSSVFEKVKTEEISLELFVKENKHYKKIFKQKVNQYFLVSNARIIENLKAPNFYFNLIKKLIEEDLLEKSMFINVDLNAVEKNLKSTNIIQNKNLLLIKDYLGKEKLESIVYNVLNFYAKTNTNTNLTYLRNTNELLNRIIFAVKFFKPILKEIDVSKIESGFNRSNVIAEIEKQRKN